MHGSLSAQDRRECWGSRVRCFPERVPGRRVRPAARSLHTETFDRWFRAKNGFARGQMTSAIVREVRSEVQERCLLCFQTMEPKHTDRPEKNRAGSCGAMGAQPGTGRCFRGPSRIRPANTAVDT